MKRFYPVLVVFFSLVFGLISFNQKAYAAQDTCTWNGGGDSVSWNDGSNWGGGVPCDNGGVPQNGDMLEIGTAGTYNNNLAGLVLAGLTISNGPVVINGNNFTMTAAIVVNPGSLTINNNLTLVAPLTFATYNNGTITINGTINLNANILTLDTSASGGNILVTNTITGAGGVTKDGVAETLISGSNNYSGPTVINAGRHNVTLSSGLGTNAGNTTVNNGGSLVLNCTGIDFSENIIINGSGDSGNGAIISGANNKILGTLNIADNSFINTVGYPFEISGVVSGNAGITLDLQSDTTFSNAANTFDGTYYVRNNKIFITANNSSATLSLAGGSAMGTGTLQNIITDNISEAAFLYPGTDTTIGMLTSNGLSSLTDTLFGINISGASTDQLLTNGLTLTNAVLEISPTATPSSSTTYMIVVNTSANPITGTFNGLAEGATFIVDSVQYRISYVGGSGNDITLEVLNFIPGLETGNLSASEINEGDTITIDVMVIDADGDLMTITIAWGDGTTTTLLNQADSIQTISHTYVDDNPTITPFDVETITITVDDGKGGNETETWDILVNNVDPAINSVTATTNGKTTTLAGNIVDPGAGDTFDFTINWGDGTIQNITVSGNTFSIGHTYATTGNYTINLSMVDDDSSAAATYVAQVTAIGLTNTGANIQGIYLIAVSLLILLGISKTTKNLINKKIRAMQQK
ncbi:MAG: PKD domain-containing protein [bacterium]